MRARCAALPETLRRRAASALPPLSLRPDASTRGDHDDRVTRQHRAPLDQTTTRYAPLLLDGDLAEAISSPMNSGHWQLVSKTNRQSLHILRESLKGIYGDSIEEPKEPADVTSAGTLPSLPASPASLCCSTVCRNSTRPAVFRRRLSWSRAICTPLPAAERVRQSCGVSARR